MDGDDQRPVQPEALLPARDQGRQPERRHAPTTSATTTSGQVDEREVVDQSFLGLVLFGAKPHDDPVIRNSLTVGDQVLRVRTPNGPIWHRFTFDGYGETATGARLGHLPDQGQPDVRARCGRS